jgi:hypothetical protein
LTYELDGAQTQDHKTPEYDDMYQACPEIAGLPLLNESVGNEIKEPFDDMRKTGIRTAQANQCIASGKDIEKEAHGCTKKQPCKNISRNTEIDLIGRMNGKHIQSLLTGLLFCKMLS